MESKNVEITKAGSAAVVEFKLSSISNGEVITGILQHVRSYVHKTKPVRVVFDFGQVRFFSSQLLGLLLEIRAQLAEYGGEVVISSVEPPLYRVFRITNLDKVFRFSRDKESALRLNAEPGR